MLSTKLENKKEKLVPLPHFFMRLLRYTMVCMLIVAFSLAIGCAGYHYFGKLGWLDSLYMSSMILNGEGPIAPMLTPSAKLFSTFYALYGGVAFLSVTAVFLTPIIHRLQHILQNESEE